MKKFLKNEKGVSLISLAVTVIIIVVITNMLLYNLRDNLKVEKLKNMQNDISNLRDKVELYYAKYGEIPANKDIEYTNLDNLKNNGIISTAVDTGKFYIIDLEYLENLTLNYGRDYERYKSIKGIEDIEERNKQINQLTDIYIINEESHNVFYVQGILVDNEIFYTDYTVEDVDQLPVVLSDLVENPLVKIDGVIIPKGFVYVGGTRDTGLIISDNMDDREKGESWEVAKDLKGNQFVWIPVTNFEDFKRYPGYSNGGITELYGYTEPYITEQEEYNKMLESVKHYGGFYVARYEAGTTLTSERGSMAGIEDEVVIKQGAIVYNYVGWSNSDDLNVQIGGAVELSRNLYNNPEKYGVVSTLCYGVQWDAIMAWIDPKYVTSECDINNSFVANSVKNGNYYLLEPAYSGSDKAYGVKNIYDLAGNLYEWTMEVNSDTYRSIRGGYYASKDSTSASYRTIDKQNNAARYYGFRPTLYIPV